MMLRIDEVLKLSFESFDIIPGESKSFMEYIDMILLTVNVSS